MNVLRKISIMAIFLCVGFHADAQKVIVAKSSVYVSGFGSFANGKYARSLESVDFKTQSWGGTFGYLTKPSKDIAFPVAVGGEFGIHGLGAGSVDNQTFVGSFNTTNTAYWLNAVARYRPIYWSSKINPFVDVAVGPKIISTGIFEQFSEEESIRIDGKTSVTLNTTIGAGVGIRLPNNEGKTIYLDVGVYYQQTGSTRIVEQNSVTLFANNELGFREQVTPLNNTQIRVGVTWFR